MAAHPRHRLAVLALAALAAAAAAQELELAPDQGLAAIEQARLDLANDRAILCFAAHPDDEDGAALAYYRKRLGLRAVNLLATRGEGGQNEIGSQLYRDLGVLRTEESEAAARLIGSEVYYLNYEDFGYSKTPEEAFERWGGKEAVVQRLTEALRLLRPDIVITNHGLLKDHGHHQACGQAILEAFDRAPDPQAYPRGPKPFVISKLYMRRPGQAAAPPGALAETPINVGQYDPLRGFSYAEIALGALRRHRSQGLWPSDDGWKGPQIQRYVLVKSNLKVSSPETELTDGLPERLIPPPPALAPEALGGPESVFGPSNDQLLQALGQEAERLDKARRADPAAAPILQARLEKIARLLALQNHIHLRATADAAVVVPGQRLGIRVQVFNGAERPVYVSSLHVASGWLPAFHADSPRQPIGAVKPGERQEAVVGVEIPNPSGRDRDVLTRPASIYWYTKNCFVPLFEVRAKVNLGGALSKSDVFLTPPVALDPPLRSPIEIEADPADAPVILGRREPAELIVRVRNNGLADVKNARLRFINPFTKEKRISQPFSVPKNGGEATAQGLAVQPPPGAAPGVCEARVEMEFPDGLPRGLEAPAPLTVRFHVLGVKAAPGLLIGVVETYDRSHEEALRALGVNFELIDEAALRSGRLERYDAILLGLRAYHDRPDVVEHNDRLLNNVKQGGHLIVAYNKTFEWNRPGLPGFAPYPLVLGTDRVSREDAPVAILNPSHPHFSFPNRVEEKDFDGWVQERCLYLPSAHDGRYEQLLECHDPGEAPRPTGHLMAHYGRGTYVYTCYVWYRQLRALNPGAYKVFANMISISKFKE